MVKLPAKEGGKGGSEDYAFKVLKLVINGNGGHPDLSLGQIVLYK